jgi:hypothetical protein
VNVRANGRLAVVAAATAVAVGGWAEGAAAPVAASARTATAVSDFASRTGKMTMQVRQRGTVIDAVAFTLTCSANADVESTPKVRIDSSGSFSYSGDATLISGPKQKKSTTSMQVNGKIDFTKAHTLRSAKTATVKASTKASHCSPYAGKLTAYYVVPTVAGD